MGYSKAWLSLTKEEQKIKRKEYQKRYKEKYPERVKEQKAKYEQKYKQRNRKKASDWQREKGRKNKLLAIQYFNNQCNDCKLTFHPVVYDFHHLDPTKKEFTFTQIAGRKWENIIPELSKCIMLCANCHRLRHVSIDYNLSN